MKLSPVEKSGNTLPEASPRQSQYLFPGGLFVHAQPHFVTTILGSCVSVCLWDRVARIGGINHFMLPLWNGRGLSTPRYGNIAIAALIDEMLGLGSNKEHLVAKIFGGASMKGEGTGIMAIGERNIALAREVLHHHDIPVLRSDVGGVAARKIIYNTGTGNVLLRRSFASG